MKNREKIGIDFDVNTDELEKVADTFERIGDAMPNIVIRNNENVYLTINNWADKSQGEGNDL